MVDSGHSLLYQFFLKVNTHSDVWSISTKDITDEFLSAPKKQL